VQRNCKPGRELSCWTEATDSSNNSVVAQSLPPCLIRPVLTRAVRVANTASSGSWMTSRDVRMSSTGGVHVGLPSHQPALNCGRRGRGIYAFMCATMTAALVVIHAAHGNSHMWRAVDVGTTALAVVSAIAQAASAWRHLLYQAPDGELDWTLIT
jgi:hypothetical protein